MNKKSGIFYLKASQIASFVLFVVVFMSVAFAAFAGGSLFGGKSSKTNNPSGVYAVGVHFCSSLECPPIRIVEGKCDGEYMQKRYGVCVCEEGYVSDGTTCKACEPGQYSDGIRGCEGCPNGKYAEEGDTSCRDCPSGFYCVGGLKYQCPKYYKNCGPSDFECKDTFVKDVKNKICTCEDGKLIKDDLCKDCTTDAPYFALCSGGKITKCVDDYYPANEGTECKPCSDLHAAKCNSETGAVIKCEAGYYNNAGVCTECEAGYYCPDGERILCPEHAECTKTDFDCSPHHYEKGTGKDLGKCVCLGDNKYEKDGECKTCPPDLKCGTCSHEGGLVYSGFEGKNKACYPCGIASDIEVDNDECETRCPNREYALLGAKQFCFAQKCGEGYFRDKEYGDCYPCDYAEGVVVEDEEHCQKCHGSRETIKRKDGEFYCVPKCELNAQLFDFNSNVCVSCDFGGEVDSDYVVKGTTTEENYCSDSCPTKRKLFEPPVGEKYCARTCSGHGHLDNHHKCVCDGNWSGPDCASLCGLEEGKPRFKDKNEECHYCEELGRVEASSKECGQCTNRTYDSDGYCYLSTCVAGNFKAKGKCYACDEAFPIKVTDDPNECDWCSTTRETYTEGGEIYCKLKSASCDGYVDKDSVCRKCTDDTAYIIDADDYDASKAECSRNCSAQREMISIYCAPKCADGEIFDTITGRCVSCTTENVSAVSGLLPGTSTPFDDCTDRCPAVRERLGDACVLTCSGHGLKEGDKCHCYKGWYGDKCDSDCDGFKDYYTDPKCHYCDDTHRIGAVKTECDRCPGRIADSGYCYPSCSGFRDKDFDCHECTDETPYEPSDAKECARNCSAQREMMQAIIGGSSYKDYCAMKCNGFRDYYGNCYSCDHDAVIGSLGAECKKCSDRYYGSDARCYPACKENEFRGADFNCYSCSDPNGVKPLEGECGKCPASAKREVAEDDMCYPACEANQFRGTDRKCYSCTEAKVFSSETECKRCVGDYVRDWIDDVCYPRCGTNSFRDNTSAHECHLCTAGGDPIDSTADECNNCTGDLARYYDSGKCYPACGGTSFRGKNNACYACNTLEGIDATLDECRKCPDTAKREIVAEDSNKCHRACGDNQFRDSTSEHACHECNDSGEVEASVTECNKCPTTRESVIVDTVYKCKLKTSAS